MKNKVGLILIILSLFQIVFSVIFPALVYKESHDFLIFSISFLLIPILICFFFYIFKWKKESKAMPIISIVISLLPLVAFIFLGIYININKNNDNYMSGYKTYSWNIGNDIVNFQYPLDWDVEKEGDVGLLIYYKANKQENIHIDGAKNECDTRLSYSRCVNSSGHKIAINAKNDASRFNQILSSLKINPSEIKSEYVPLCIAERDVDACYKKNAIAKNDINLCDLMSGSIDTWGSLAAYQKNDCYQKIAILNKDFSICDQKLGSDPMCYQDVAVATGADSMCEKVSQEGGYRNACYQKIAEQKKDLSICYKIENTLDSKGKKFWENEACYSMVAIAKKDASICKLIKNVSSLFFQCIAGTREKFDFEGIALDTNTWLTYKNDQYGFEFKYPKEIMVSDQIKDENLFLANSIGISFSVAAKEKNKLSFNEIPGGGGLFYYDEKNNVWMNDNHWEQKKAVPCSDLGYQNFLSIGTEKVPALHLGTGDAGFAFSSYFIITNKDFGLEIGIGISAESEEKEIKIQDAMLNSFKLINDTKGIEPLNCKN